MKRLLLLAVLAMLLLPMASAPAQGAYVWSVTASEAKVANGASVEIRLTGAPGSLALINFTCLAAPDYAWDEHVRLLSDGNGTLGQFIDWEAPAGVYNVTVFQGGNLLAVTNFTVYLDKAAMALHRCDVLEAALAANNAMDVRQDRAIAEANRQIASIWPYVMFAFACSIIVTIFVAKKMAPLLKYEMKRDSDKAGMFRGIRRFVSTITYPDPEGLKLKVMPTLREEAERLRQQNEDEYAEPMVVLKVNGEFRAYPLNDGGEVINIVDRSPEIEAKMAEMKKMLDNIKTIAERPQEAPKAAEVPPARPTEEAPKAAEVPPARPTEEAPKAAPPLSLKERLEAARAEAAALDAHRKVRELAAAKLEEERRAAEDTAMLKELEELEAKISAERVAAPAAPPAPSAANPPSKEIHRSERRSKRHQGRGRQMSAEEIETHNSALSAAPVIDPKTGRVPDKQTPAANKGVPL